MEPGGAFGQKSLTNTSYRDGKAEQANPEFLADLEHEFWLLGPPIWLVAPDGQHEPNL